MPTKPSERFEFVSEAWVRAARQSFEAGVNRRFSIAIRRS